MPGKTYSVFALQPDRPDIYRAVWGDALAGMDGLPAGTTAVMYRDLGGNSPVTETWATQDADPFLEGSTYNRTQ